MSKLSLIDRFHHWRRKNRWNRQYKKGKWDYLNNDREDLRYQKIVEFISKYASKNPTILDLGAGEAVLNGKFDKNSYSHFYNVDFSKNSIDKAKQKQLPNSTSLVADIHNYNPNKTYDVIVFNEAYYYVHHNLKKEVLNRFISKLKPNGLLVVSIYKEGLDCWEIIDANTSIEKLDFGKVDTDREQTYWKVGAYRVN
ncbi:trans-aconitate 2-methyltransferase [Mesoflavibacter sp. SCSIO 43206]|uniref:class I SAM-dependent methyltransferase n=1 Tax=Mesoflavibacter TaxID=444051 RepID=UPI001CA9E3C5|nr:class I SAM-dependent methyltransferase [Mesoflavibacter sp. SCSIO 43206]UAB74621.1 methyltransferase domain-containing protein [Mesoflavibacter sp. SCSIO 43206]